MSPSPETCSSRRRTSGPTPSASPGRTYEEIGSVWGHFTMFNLRESGHRRDRRRLRPGARLSRVPRVRPVLSAPGARTNRSAPTSAGRRRAPPRPRRPRRARATGRAPRRWARWPPGWSAARPGAPTPTAGVGHSPVSRQGLARDPGDPDDVAGHVGQRRDVPGVHQPPDGGHDVGAGSPLAAPPGRGRALPVLGAVDQPGDPYIARSSGRSGVNQESGSSSGTGPRYAPPGRELQS